MKKGTTWEPECVVWQPNVMTALGWEGIPTVYGDRREAEAWADARNARLGRVCTRVERVIVPAHWSFEVPLRRKLAAARRTK